MIGVDQRRLGVSSEPKPHAYDPLLNPELFAGVLLRRTLAFVVDVLVISIPVIAAAILIFFLGIITLSLGWLLFGLLSPGAVIWALVYYGMTLGGPYSATVGMRIMDIEMRTWYGSPAYFVLGAVHAIVFWITVSFLSPLVLIVGLLNPRRRLLHDILVGTIVVNNPARAAAMRPLRSV